MLYFARRLKVNKERRGVETGLLNAQHLVFFEARDLAGLIRVVRGTWKSVLEHHCGYEEKLRGLVSVGREWARNGGSFEMGEASKWEN